MMPVLGPETVLERPWLDLKRDLERYGPLPWVLQPAVYAVLVYRLGRWTRQTNWILRTVWHPIYFASYSVVRLATGIDLPRSAQFGPGLLIHHFGGIVINPRAVVGANFTMRHNFTIGSARDGGGVPTVGDHVTVGVNSALLGQIAIGSNVTIGAFTLVLNDVPDDSIAIGIPARIRRHE